ncbi:MAG: PrpR N-terminal domain-containing protein [Lachnospirales bacterium]
MKKIKVLAIAPYEEMKNQIENVSMDYENVALTISIGDLDEGVKIAKNKIGEMYDVILSRGGTASLIEKISPIPVIEIQISVYDILCALKLSQVLVEAGANKKIAIVGYKNITQNAHLLCEVLNYNLDVYTIEDKNMVETILQYVKQKGYHMIICDMVTNTVAKKYGIDTILINSGKDSIKKAFEDALKIVESNIHLAEENFILRNIIQKKKDYTIILDRNATVYYSTLDENVDTDFVFSLINMEVKNNIHEHRKIVKYRNQMLYSLRVDRIETETTYYYVFSLKVKKINSTLVKNKIVYQSAENVETMVLESRTMFSEAFNMFEPYINSIKKSNSPIMVMGENGTGKEQAVHYLYYQSSIKNFPLIMINCQSLNERLLLYLLENNNSPLFDCDNTLFFQNVESLKGTIADELIENLLIYNVPKRNQIFFSCNIERHKNETDIVRKIVDKLNCLTIFLPSLREQPNNIPTLISRYFNELNGTLDYQIAGISPEGVRLLQKFEWTNNYTQIKRLLNNIAAVSKSPIISTDLVAEVLEKEKRVLNVYVDNLAETIDLSKTLSEIEVEIVKKVLSDVDNNQTKAAERLGIGRTTLWRMLK